MPDISKAPGAACGRGPGPVDIPAAGGPAGSRRGALPIAEAPPATLRPLRILLVQHEPAEARRVSQMICAAPPFACQCEQAGSLAAALARLSRSDIDVVVLDLHLPDSQGLKTLDAIIESRRELATVVLTVDDVVDGAEAVRRGAQDYLAKAELAPPLLMRAIRYAYERKARENELLRAEAEFELLSRLTRGLSEAPDLGCTLATVLEEICLATGWAYGELWLPDSHETLVRGPVCREATGVDSTAESLRLRRGEGLPGRVWQRCLPLWIPDVAEAQEWVRSDVGRAAGFRAALAIPVMAGSEVVGVLAFHDLQVRPRDQRLLHLVDAAASHVGGILKRRQAEDALTRSEQRLRQLMDIAQDGILVTDRDGRIAYANGRALALLGRPAEAVVGASPADLLSGIAAGGGSEPLGSYPAAPDGVVESRVLRPDEAEVWVITSFSSVVDDGGDFAGSIILITDITRMKREEEADRVLAEAGQVFASSLDPAEMVERVTALLVPAVADGCAIRLLREGGDESAAAVATDASTEATLLRMLAVFPAAPADADHPIRVSLRTGETVLFGELDEGLVGRLAEDAEQRAILLGLRASSALFTPLGSKGGPLGYLVLLTTTSARRLGEAETALAMEIARLTSLGLENARLYREARDAIRARDEMMGVVAHDLRNPLGAVSMYSALLEDETAARENREKWLAGIRRSVEQMDALIQDLLDVTRLEAGYVRIEKAEVDVAAIVEESFEMFATVAREREVQLEREVVGEPARLSADSGRLLQVLTNLIGNALKFTPAGGRVIIRAEQAEGATVFSVRDTGVGIAADQLPLVFDRFWQAGRSSGAGLGLTIAKGLVEVHGGTITAESEEGRGSVFRFSLPNSAGPEAAAAPASPAAAPEGGRAAAREPIRVVIADDHHIFLSSLEEVLVRSGRIDIVARSPSGELAIERTQSLRPDLVLMDLEMEGIGGLDAIRQIASLEPPVPVIALTANSEEEALFPALEAGASGFLRKSSSPEELLEMIEAVVDGGAALSPSSQRAVLDRFLEQRGAALPGPLRSLSEQERAILTLVAGGYNSAEIGRRLFLSPKTVDTYRSRLMRRLGLHHRSDIVHFALRTGLLRATPTEATQPPVARG
jgi:PAS domain S-box-containing protein